MRIGIARKLGKIPLNDVPPGANVLGRVPPRHPRRRDAGTRHSSSAASDSLFGFGDGIVNGPLENNKKKKTENNFILRAENNIRGISSPRVHHSLALALSNVIRGARQVL